MWLSYEICVAFVWWKHDARTIYAMSSAMLNIKNMQNNMNIKYDFEKFKIFKIFWLALERKFAGNGKLHVVATIVSSVFEGNLVVSMKHCLDSIVLILC